MHAQCSPLRRSVVDAELRRISPPVAFAHANGFTPGAYRSFLEALGVSDHAVSLELAPLRSGSVPDRSWHVLAEEVASQVDAVGGPVVGLGHSLGATLLLLTAAAEPSRFRQLTLVEPVALPAWLTLFLHVAPSAVRRRGPLARAARERVDRWPDEHAAFAAYRRRRRFAKIPDEVLRDVLEDGLAPTPQGVMLRYSTQWEATLYESPPNIWRLLRLRLPPIVLVRGEASDLFDSRTVKRWLRMRPLDGVVTVAGSGHLLPLEQPQGTAFAILRALGRD
jgi:pimeloyl-ACP methyl ester carboxylesterase